ncbi:DUF6193 family natural product biosynthesis protein [Streptomyces sp. NPDC050095]|uniref:DUF6193 family natural product biosynthesis protein n=1 Tax=unclassified Streptomyces TaxID=2593676 RepID=UPI0034337F50
MSDNSGVCASEWQYLVDAHKSPHGERDWFGPLFWPLLQAANGQPTLRGVYPSMAANNLVVYRDSETWRAPVEDRWPAVAVSADGSYGMRSDAWAEDARELLVTRNPQEAANFLAELIKGIQSVESNR